MVRAASIAAAVLALGCGRSAAGPRASASGGGPDPSTTPPATAPAVAPPTAVPCDGLVTVRLRGVNGSAFDEFSVDLGMLTVDGGAVVVASETGKTVSLTGDGAPKVAVVRPPPDGAPFHATLVLVNGAAHRTDGSGAMFDAANGSFEVTVDPSKVNPASCHAVIHLDLDGSVVPVRGWRASAIVPRFSLHY